MKQRAFDSVTIIIFLLLISLPTAFKILNVETGQSISENRNPEPAPQLQIHLAPAPSLKAKTITIYRGCARFVSQFDNYFSKTFKLRDQLLRFYNFLKLDLVHTNPLPHKVVRGTDEWFFLGDSHSNVIKESKGILNFSNRELTNLSETLMSRKKWLESKGIKYYLAIAPNKLSVYGQYLPIQRSNNPTKLDQLKDMAKGDVNVIDLKDDFSNARGIRLYHKSDSHWNDYGAYLGYKTLLEKVKLDFPAISIESQTNYAIDTIISDSQDLIKMISLQTKEESIVFNPVTVRKSKSEEKILQIPASFPFHPSIYEERYTSDVNNLKVLVFRDSFTTNLVKYMRESFGESVFVWDHTFRKDLIERESPDILIQIIIEREIDLLLGDQ